MVDWTVGLGRPFIWSYKRRIWQMICRVCVEAAGDPWSSQQSSTVGRRRRARCRVPAADESHLAGDDQRTIDLADWERRGKLRLRPRRGRRPATWTDRLAPLACPEVHVLDRLEEPTSSRRRQLAAHINRVCRPPRLDYQKRTLENDSHAAAVHEALAVDIPLGDDGDVAKLVAQTQWDKAAKPIPWAALSLRARKRLRDKTKRRRTP